MNLGGEYRKHEDLEVMQKLLKECKGDSGKLERQGDQDLTYTQVFKVKLPNKRSCINLISLHLKILNEIF